MMKSRGPHFKIGHRYLPPAALGATVALLALALAPAAASAKTLPCGTMALGGGSPKAYNITATGLSCKAAKSVIGDFARGHTPKGWKTADRYIASAHSLKWTLKKGREVITFEVKKTS